MIHQFLLKQKTIASTQDTDCVDLGLPSGLLWARCNIGANYPYEYGDYFMWGSTKPDTNKRCDWQYAPFNDGNLGFDKKYFKSIQDDVCPKGVLVPEYDAAAIILGPDWRLPTKEDFQELLDHTKHEWINNYKDSKINGMLFQTKDAKLCTELFIPASGHRYKSSFIDQGSVATLWSSSFNISTESCARCFYLYDYCCYISYDIRCNGFCLRGVKK